MSEPIEIAVVVMLTRVGAGTGRTPLLSSSLAEAGERRGLSHPLRDLAFVEVVQRFEIDAARVLAHPDRRDRRDGRE